MFASNNLLTHAIHVNYQSVKLVSRICLTLSEYFSFKLNRHLSVGFLPHQLKT